MENEVKEQEEAQEEVDTQDNESEESTEDEESTDEDSSDDTSSSPTLEDYEKLKKEAETLKAQKEHWRKKATLKPDSNKESKQENTEKNNDNYLTRDEAILLTKGYDEDDIKQLKRLAGDNSLIEASNDPLFQSYKKDKEKKEKASKAQLSSSNRPLGATKPVSEMSEKEHRELFYKTLKNR